MKPTQLSAKRLGSSPGPLHRNFPCVCEAVVEGPTSPNIRHVRRYIRVTCAFQVEATRDAEIFLCFHDPEDFLPSKLSNE